MIKMDTLENSDDYIYFCNAITIPTFKGFLAIKSNISYTKKYVYISSIYILPNCKLRQLHINKTSNSTHQF